MTASSDPSDLIRAATEALDGITPGPWVLHDRGIGVEVHAPNGADSVDPNGTHCLTDDDVFDERYAPRSMANAVFIANAPTLVRRLRDALRAEQKDGEIIANALDEERAYSAHLKDEVTRAKEWSGVSQWMEHVEVRRWAAWLSAEKDYMKSERDRFENARAAVVVKCADVTIERDTARAALAEANTTIEHLRARVEPALRGLAAAIDSGKDADEAVDEALRAVEGEQS